MHPRLSIYIISAPRLVFPCLWFFRGNLVRAHRQLLSGATPEQVQKGLDDLFGAFYEAEEETDNL